MNKEIILLSNKSPLKQTCNHFKKNFQDHVYNYRGKRLLSTHVVPFPDPAA